MLSSDLIVDIVYFYLCACVGTMYVIIIALESNLLELHVPYWLFYSVAIKEEAYRQRYSHCGVPGTR